MTMTLFSFTTIIYLTVIFSCIQEH